MNRNVLDVLTFGVPTLLITSGCIYAMSLVDSSSEKFGLMMVILISLATSGVLIHHRISGK